MIYFVCIPGEEYGHSKKRDSLCSKTFELLLYILRGVVPRYVMYAFVRVPTAAAYAKSAGPPPSPPSNPTHTRYEFHHT